MQKRARNKWGGRRDGAGRPPAGAIASERHETRPQITARDAIRIIARVVPTSLDASRTREAVAREKGAIVEEIAGALHGVPRRTQRCQP